MDHDNPDEPTTIRLSDLTSTERKFTQDFVDHLIAEITTGFRQHQITADLSVTVVDNGFDISVICDPEVYKRALDLTEATYENIMRKIAESPTN